MSVKISVSKKKGIPVMQCGDCGQQQCVAFLKTEKVISHHKKMLCL